METLKKEQIRDRMVRLAAAQWQIPENEIEAHFDPLLMLIFDVLAAEVETIGHQIDAVSGRLLNELSSIMLPHALLRAKPASCILTAMPVERTVLLNEEHSFSAVVTSQDPGMPVAETELNFTPNGTVKLFKLSTGYLRTGGKVYKLDEAGRRSLIHDEPAATVLVDELHLTLHSREVFDTLQGLQLFFDLKGHSEASNFYFALQQAQLFINGVPAAFSGGCYQQQQYETGLKDSLAPDGDYSRKIRREIAGIYGRQFITVAQENLPGVPEDPLFLAGLPGKLQETIYTGETIYLTLRLSRHFSREVLERLLISVNAFPVINRKPEKIHFKTDRWINIIPLPVQGSFLDIKSIEGIEGTRYQLRPDPGKDTIEEGQAIMRTSRIGKDSSRDVRNSINSLLESIRDESAYFSRISNDFIAAQLNEISKLLARLQDRLLVAKDERPAFYYVLLRSKKQQETVFVQYWSTAPATASALKAFTVFKPVMHSLTAGPCIALTGTSGGVETFSDYTQKQMLVRQLSSRGKIISREDIRLLCFELFGIRLKNVIISKAMHILQGARNGITKVIDIELQLREQDYTADELAYLQKLLHYQLENHASFVLPFESRITYID
ncbi:hypothetical protein [Niabella beijingensis]|uniref:hypothetical protein n=1 Tax=Niabella beijingensis TaxID=2872700 RepID=UPI001CBCA978|nr:hypothetical protein [Niabella beijingensis]MBZ4188382.1 hypothetical protein [Niabella beijingensis]